MTEFKNKFDDPHYMFTYDETAKCCLRWKNSKRWSSIIGKECGTLNKHNKNWCVQFRGSPKFAQRIIWEMFNGPLHPCDSVVFNDGDTTNVKISNLSVIRFDDKNWQDPYLKSKDLQKVFSYEDGALYWKGDRYSGAWFNKITAKDGDPLCTVEDKDGYLRTKVGPYPAKGMPPIHRLVYEYFNGPIPKGMQIDHIDGDVKNNKIENLRCVPSAVNGRNMKMHSRNRTGVMGVRERYKSDGSVKGYEAHWRNLDGSFGSKSYSCSIYGEKGAFDLAVKAREDAISRLNEILGDEGYHENHGKRA